MPDLVRLDRCSKSYRRGSETVHALRDATLVLAPGELVALIGPSASGKTTLLNVLIGWETPDRGRVSWPGLSADRPWRDLGIVPQRLGLVEDLTVAENLALPLRLAGRPAGGIDPLMDALDLAAVADRLPDEVSLGEQQRAAVARALVLGPRLAVLDEPTGHQDEEHAKLVLAALRQARDAGTCCLLATHATEAVAHADRVVTMRDGRVSP